MTSSSKKSKKRRTLSERAAIKVEILGRGGGRLCIRKKKRGRGSSFVGNLKDGRACIWGKGGGGEAWWKEKENRWKPQ